MLYLILVFGHLLATSMALGAIVATDLRMLSKLAHDRVRIPPPNEFVARLVTIALVLLYLTGAGMLWIKSQQPEALLNPKLQGKLVLVLLLTVNAVVLHRWTFPRLARGRSVGRWRAADWIVVVMPVALSNCLWMFCAFLGIARPWNDSMPMRDVLEIAATLYAVALVGVACVLAAASRQQPDEAGGPLKVFKRALASIGRLGQDRQRRRCTPRTRAKRPRRRSGRSRIDASDSVIAKRRARTASERSERASASSRAPPRCGAPDATAGRGGAETLRFARRAAPCRSAPRPPVATPARRSSSARSPARPPARGRAARPPRAAPP